MLGIKVLPVLPSLKMEIPNYFAPLLALHHQKKFFCKNHWLEAFKVFQKAISPFVQTVLFLQRSTKVNFGKTGRIQSFNYNTFDNSNFRHRIARVSNCSSKKLFAIKLFHFCDSKTQQRYILEEGVNFSKRELDSLVDSLRDLFKAFDQASKCIQIPYRNPKLILDKQNQKAISFFIIIMISLNIQIDIFVFRYELKRTNLASVSSKRLKYVVSSSYL